MVTYFKSGGSWHEPKDIFVKDGGTWVPSKSIHQKVEGSWVEIFKAAIEYTVSETTTNLDLSNLFDPSDWSSDKDKIVTIPVGVIVGSTDAASYNALRTGTGRGGTLTINVQGEVQGGYGPSNGGAGGNAILVEQTGVTINNTGSIRAGGGGGGAGGAGGTGGQGSYSYPVYSSWFIELNNHPLYYYGGSGINYPVVFANSAISSGAAAASGVVTVGGYTYYRGSPAPGSQAIYYNYIRRSYPATAYTSGGAGGAGGNGGRGQGYGQSVTSGSAGSAGSAGGTNAGTGGTGGTGGAGGTWGVAGSPGSTGATGNAGNYTSGVAGVSGSSGGAAGRAIYLIETVTVNNSGTIQGAIE
jgi:hypothetical protein